MSDSPPVRSWNCRYERLSIDGQSDPVSLAKDESSSVLRGRYAIGDTRVSLVSFFSILFVRSTTLATEEDRTPPRSAYLRSSRYVNTWNEKTPHLGRPTAAHRIVFCRHLSSRSGITLPRWYTMTFILGFVRGRRGPSLHGVDPTRTYLSSDCLRYLSL